MAIWYISTTGSDTTGDGSVGNPYATVSKCLTVCSNTDSIKALTGTYTITSTTNVDKQVTITSNSGVKTDVIFSSNCTIFNVQQSNVSITYVTLQTSSTSELVTIDRMSTGSTVPTFWTGITINNCNVKYVTNALALNGTFTVTSNAFTRMSGTNVADVIKVYSCRGSSAISSNTFTDSQPVRYLLSLTSKTDDSGTYLDRCNSKGGTLTIVSNTVTFTHGSQVTTFLLQDYFNQYSYGTVGADTQYNINTRLSLAINNNNVSYSTTGKPIVIDTKSNSDYSMFGVNNINTNTFNNTDYGVLHLEKDTSSHGVLTISSTDLNRSVFKIYSNTLDTIIPPTNYFLDLSVAGTLRKSDGTAAEIGDTVQYIRLSNGSTSNQTTRVIPAILDASDGTAKRAIKFGIETVAPVGLSGHWQLPTLQALGYTSSIYYEWSFFCVMSLDPALIQSWERSFDFGNFGFGHYEVRDVFGFSANSNDGNGVEVYPISYFTSGAKVFCFRARPNVAKPGSYLLGRVSGGSFVEDDVPVRYGVDWNLSISKTQIIRTGRYSTEVWYLPVNISEYRIYPNAFTDSEFMAIHDGLKTKWGIS